MRFSKSAEHTTEAGNPQPIPKQLRLSTQQGGLDERQRAFRLHAWLVIGTYKYSHSSLTLKPPTAQGFHTPGVPCLLSTMLLELWHERTLASYAAETQMLIDNSYGRRRDVACKWLGNTLSCNSISILLPDVSSVLLLLTPPNLSPIGIMLV
ncbi:hypothetical protein GX50_08210 [[Emmonsia] crescens]|uniref:Uncharacterized protein n=1 Tax=[Emmonsia] crescens TaxID=73230 RepID=A0A2B7Z7Q2_9EURO|nr:hypothetical protein GX50_08210 [Emmonsia crescens]